jgi:hypothetical protein
MIVAIARQPKKIRRAFTLLEVILSLALMSMVVLAMFSIFNIYSRLFEKGGVQVAHAQLVTAVERQLRDDFMCMMEDSPESKKGAAKSSGGARRFGLNGTSDTLRFDVWQMLPEDQLPLSDELPELGLSTGVQAHAPELKTIVYRFTSEDSSDQASQQMEAASGSDLASKVPFSGPGLVRWEVNFEISLNDDANAASLKEVLNGAKNAASGNAGGNANFTDLLTQAAADKSLTWMPEIRSISFRYFDGRSWSSQWNSLSRGSLPVAVEVTFQVRESSQAESGAASQESNTSSDVSNNSNEDVAAETSEIRAQLSLISGGTGSLTESDASDCRFVIRLPLARNRPEIKPANDTALGGNLGGNSGLDALRASGMGMGAGGRANNGSGFNGAGFNGAGSGNGALGGRDRGFGGEGAFMGPTMGPPPSGAQGMSGPGDSGHENRSEFSSSPWSSSQNGSSQGGTSDGGTSESSGTSTSDQWMRNSP